MDESLPYFKQPERETSRRCGRWCRLVAAIDPHLPDGRTPLHLCAVRDDATMAEVLLNHGADVDAQDEKHPTPLRIAISSHSHA